MPESIGAGVTQDFEESFQRAAANIGKEFTEQLVARDGVVVSLETGDHAKRDVDTQRWWPVTLTVSVNPRHLIDQSAQLGYLSEDVEWGEELCNGLIETLCELMEWFEPEEVTRTDPDNIRLFVTDAGPSTVTYDTSLSLPMDEVASEDETVYEVVHRETAATAVRIPDSKVGGSAAAVNGESLESAVIQNAGAAEGEGLNTTQFEEVLSVREVESVYAEKDEARKARDPLTNGVENDGIPLMKGDVLRVNGREVIALGAVMMGAALDLRDVETGEWVKRVSVPEAAKWFRYGDGEWEYVGQVSDETMEAFREAENAVEELQSMTISVE